jgi:hypothetical protein
VSHDRKELLDIRTVITHPVLEENVFFNESDGKNLLQKPDKALIPIIRRRKRQRGRIYFRSPTRPSSPSSAGERDRGEEFTSEARQGPHPRHPQEKETEGKDLLQKPDKAHIPVIHRRKRRRYQGPRSGWSGCLVRIRRREGNLPLPSVLLANVQSIDNKID